MAFRAPRRDLSPKGTDFERRIKEKQPIGAEHDEYKKYQDRANEAFAEFKRLKGSRDWRQLKYEELEECLGLLRKAEKPTIDEIDARIQWNLHYKEGQGSGTKQKRTGHKGVDKYVQNRKDFLEETLQPEIDNCRAYMNPTLAPPASVPIDFEARQREADRLRNSRGQAIEDRSHYMSSMYADHQPSNPASQASHSSHASGSGSHAGSYGQLSQPSYISESGSHVGSYGSQPSHVPSDASHSGGYGPYDSQSQSQHSQSSSYHDAAWRLSQTGSNYSDGSADRNRSGTRETSGRNDQAPRIDTVSTGWSHEYSPDGTKGALNEARLRWGGNA